jgi:hypothetical protein
MANNTFIIQKIVFESNKNYYEVSTDGDNVYIQRQDDAIGESALQIDIDDFFAIITFIEKEIK